MRFYFLIILFTFFASALSAQIPVGSEAEALEQLENRGISEEEFRARMLEKGYDLDNIKPEQIPQLQSVIEETLSELEEENKKSDSNAPSQTETANPAPKQESRVQDKNTDTPVGISDENVIEAVEDGATVEEAITEEISEQTNSDNPPAPVYGQNIFRNQTLEVYRSADNIKPPDTYVLGSGDDIIISIFGRSQAEFAFTINEEGFIKPTGISRIYLKGLTLETARRLLRQRFSQYYSFAPEQFSFTVNAARTITVNIFGEVENFGSFTISAINTAFNALVAAGGPTDIGTVRKIKLIRGTEVKILDVYDFLFNPNVQYDYFLQNNDIIQIPTSEKIVTIKGAVKRPFKYELIDEEDLVDLIRYAGGLNVNAYLKNVQVNRIIGGQRVIIDVDLEEIIAKDTGFALENGDEVQVRIIPERLENFAEVEGAVEFEGKYELTPGTKVTDLLARAELREDSRTDVAFLQRKNSDESVRLIKLNIDSLQNGTAEDYVLQRRDKIVIYSQKFYTDSYNVEIDGAVRQPKTYAYEQGLTVADLINLSGGLRPDATDFAYVTRTDFNNSDLLEYIRIDIKQAVAVPTSVANLMLQPRDRVLVMSSSSFSDEFQIRVAGAVRAPGSFQYAPTLDLNDVLTLAGGLQISAAANRIDIFRVILNENEPTQTVVATVQVDKNLNIVTGGEIELEPFDLVVVRNVPDFELQNTVTLNGEVRYPGVYALITENEKLTDVIKRAGGLTAEAFPEGAQLFRTESNIGFVILDLDKALNAPGSRFNYILKDGDNVTIPKSKDLVTILLRGTLAAELYPDKMLDGGKLSVAYVKGKNAEWYLNEYAAGINRKKRARRRLITVEHPNGQIENDVALFSSPSVSKGSIINVGLKPKKEPKEKEDSEPIDWNKVVTDTIAIASGVLTVLVLAARL